MLKERIKALDLANPGQIAVKLLALQMAMILEQWDEADQILDQESAYG